MKEFRYIESGDLSTALEHRELFLGIGRLAQERLGRIGNSWVPGISVRERDFTNDISREVTNIENPGLTQVHHFWWRRIEVFDKKMPSGDYNGEVRVTILMHTEDACEIGEILQSILFGTYAAEMAAKRPDKEIRYLGAPSPCFEFVKHNLKAEAYPGLHLDGDLRVDYRGPERDYAAAVGFVEGIRGVYERNSPTCKIVVRDTCYATDGGPIGDGLASGADYSHLEIGLEYGLRLESWKVYTAVVPYVRYNVAVGQFEPGHLLIEVFVPEDDRLWNKAGPRDFAGRYLRWRSEREETKYIVVADNGLVRTKFA